MALPHRARFQRGQRYVAVRRIKLGHDRTLAPGEPVEGFRPWRLKSWYRRGLIGVEGDAWTRWQLEHQQGRLEREQKRVPARERKRTEGASMLSSIRSALSRSEAEEPAGDDPDAA